MEPNADGSVITIRWKAGYIMPTSHSIFIPSSLSRYRYLTYEEKNRTDHSILYPTSFVHSLSISHQEINIISVHLRNIIPLFLLEVDRWLNAKMKIFKDLQYYYPIWVFFLNGFLPTCNVVFYTIDQKLTHYDCAQKVSLHSSQWNLAYVKIQILQF